MKSVENKNIKRVCNFYVSDIHLSVMLLPYISNEINNNVNITTIFEELDKENFTKVLNKLNIKNKEKILNINWFNKKTNEEIESILKNLDLSSKNNTIIIEGSIKYINEINKKIHNYVKKDNTNNIKIVDCYNVEEVSSNMKEIVKKYDKVLNTCGELLTK